MGTAPDSTVEPTSAGRATGPGESPPSPQDASPCGWIPCGAPLEAQHGRLCRGQVPERVRSLARRLCLLVGEAQEASMDLERALLACERAAVAVDVLLSRTAGQLRAAQGEALQERAQRLAQEQEVKSSVEMIWSLGDKLHQLASGACPTPSVCQVTIAAAAEHCTAALPKLEDKLSGFCGVVHAVHRSRSPSGRFRAPSSDSTNERMVGGKRRRNFFSFSASQCSDSGRRPRSLVESQLASDEPYGKGVLPLMSTAAEWQKDTAQCSLCSWKLGQVFMRPRHHCRACGRCVCGPCSPNLITLEEGGRPHRVCNLCASETREVVESRGRLVGISQRLASLTGLPDVLMRNQEGALSFADVVKHAEDSLDMFEEVLASSRKLSAMTEEAMSWYQDGSSCWSNGKLST